MLRSSAWLVVVSACATVDDPPTAAPSDGLDEAVFRCSVEPVLVRECSYTACHGIASSPLRIYSQGKLRASPPTSLDASTAALTAAEHHANFLAASGFAFGAPDELDNLLLRKPIAPSFGGFAHEGGAIFATTADPEWSAMRAWLAGTGSCP